MAAGNNGMNRGVWAHIGVVALCVVALATAYTTTQQTAVKRADLKCGLLGSDCDRLTPGAQGQFGLRYVNPSASWRHYTKIIVDPVTFWGSDTTKVSAAEQQALTDYFFQVLREQLGQKFQLVDEAGPGVMRM